MITNNSQEILTIYLKTLMKNLTFLKLFVTTMFVMATALFAGCVDDNDDTEAPRLEVSPKTLVFDTEWAQAVRKGDWKWIKVKDGKKFGNFTVPAGEYLYNLSYDIREENNQKEKHPQIVRELSGIHAEWRNDKPNSISPEKAAELFH